MYYLVLVLFQNWRPPGCEKLGQCFKPPTSNKVKCSWPHLNEEEKGVKCKIMGLLGLIYFNIKRDKSQDLSSFLGVIYVIYCKR